MADAKTSVADGIAGMTWWNGMDDADRRFWMLASMGTSASDAWEYFKRCTAAGLSPSYDAIAATWSTS